MGSSPFLPPSQRMMTIPALAKRSLADTQKRIHAQLLHRRHIKDLNRNAHFFQASCAPGQLRGKEDVWRFIHQITREVDAAGNCGARGINLLHGRHIGDGDCNFDFLSAVVVLLALGLVAIERIGTQRLSRGPGQLPRQALALRPENQQ